MDSVVFHRFVDAFAITQAVGLQICFGLRKRRYCICMTVTLLLACGFALDYANAVAGFA
jgi:hypothetical protein